MIVGEKRTVDEDGKRDQEWRRTSSEQDRQILYQSEDDRPRASVVLREVSPDGGAMKHIKVFPGLT
jgi:hypothetical protein